MLRLRYTVVAALVVAAAAAPLACGGSDDNSQDENIRQVEIQSLAAYACMPKDLRRQLRTLERRHDARIRQLARRSAPRGTTAPPNFQQTVQSDPLRGQLLKRARGIYRRYLPGGAEYDPGCFLRERDAAEQRLENVGTTGGS